MHLGYESITPLEREEADREISIRRYNKILTMVLDGAPLSNILSALVRQIEYEKLGTRASVLLLSDDGLSLLNGAAPNLPDAYNLAIHGVNIGEGVGSCGEAAFSGNRVIVEDIATHPNWIDFKGLALSRDLLACWSEPIKGISGDVLGTFAMYYDQIKSPSTSDLILIQEAARLASLAIERSRAFQFQRQASAIFNQLPIALVTTNAEGHILDANETFFNTMSFNGEDKRPKVFSPTKHLSITGHSDGELIAASLTERGHWQGEAKVFRFDGQDFDAEITAMAFNDSSDNTIFAWLISDVSERKQAQDLIYYQANYDPLTELPNRAQLFERITELTLRADKADGFTLMLMDIDNFKQVNDSLGHYCGDQLLIEVGCRLKRLAGDTSTVARLGGDEFALLLPNVCDIDAIRTFAQKIINTMQQRYALSDSKRVYSSMSIGIARFGEDAHTLEKLLNCADQAMYVAKEAGKGRYQFFNQGMQQRAERTALMHTWLKTALATKQFELLYQPIIEVSTGKVVHAEALIRWYREGETISPLEFIPVAETDGSIVEIGEWVREQGMHLLYHYGSSYGFSLSVNVSTQEIWSHLLQDGLLTSIDRIAARLGDDFPFDQLTLEITESLLMEGRSNLIKAFEQLRAKGCKIAVDDFGTGYSSLSYLNYFPIDQLKIDKSFIRNCQQSPKQQALVNAITKMSHALNLTVVAEGVEDQWQLEFVKSVGIDFVQGYFYSKPLNKKDFIALLEASKSR
ncbi:bifunctional diguanylate cyclase/phosphodiesterase [Shewanella colwelliana]|uniref:bifunctional diguanylate cyclase/phosphodiesterase n=1 Tax=Shewanella colwelliana TaxID=23 RepID=UPI001BC6BEBB|nr:EAL domain-containing protein [Shewanella colwelliana]GIU30314.1 bifunctional diguanylate cyclase/phosphodiesterase [Shewanella colwelliana]